MYMIFEQSMFMGEVCKFYELASNNHSQQVCLGYKSEGEVDFQYKDNPQYFIEKSGFRYPAFLMGLVFPLIFFVIEFF